MTPGPAARGGRMRDALRRPAALTWDWPWVALGVLVTLAASWRVVSTPGELVQGDLEYPFANEFWTRPYTSGWDTSYGSTLVNIQRTFTYAPWGLAAQAFDLSTEAASKFHWLSWQLLAVAAGYAGARLLLGAQIRARHPVAVRAGLLLAGLFWALNPWALARWEQLGVHVSAVLLPLLMGLVVSAARAETARARAHRALAAAATLAFAVSTSPHYMAIGALLALGWFVVAVTTARADRRSAATTAVVFAGGYAVFAAFTLVPFAAALVGGSPAAPGYLDSLQETPSFENRHSILDTLALTGHHFFGPYLKPAAAALPGWHAAALLPAALVAYALWRQPGQRRMLAYAAAAGGVTALVQIASRLDATSAAYQHVVFNVPFGWVLREPNKFSGVLAVAYLPGIALAPAAFARDAPPRLPAIGAVQTAALGIVLAAFMLPGIGRMMWDTHGISLVPERFPASFHSLPAEIDRRNAQGASRTFLALWDLRLPSWSSNRVLGNLEGLAVTTPYAASGNSAVGARLRVLLERDPAHAVDVARAQGVARVLVATGTPRGQATARRLRQTEGFEPEIGADYYEVFRTVDAAYPWVYEHGPAGPVELPWKHDGMHRLVIDVPDDPPAGHGERVVATQEFWDPMWTADLPGHAASVEPSEHGLLRVRLGPGSSGRLVLEFGLHRALAAGHAITWAGLAAWAAWLAWPRLSRLRPAWGRS